MIFESSPQWLSVYAVTFFFFWKGVCVVVVTEASVSLFFEPAVIDTTAKIASLPFAGAQTIDFHVVSGNSIDLRHPHSLQCYHVTWTSAWYTVAVYTMDINTVLCHSIGHGYHHSSQW